MNNSINATMILVLGILSIICLPLLGPVAWVMGNNALLLIDSGRADSTQRGSVVAGRICGVIGTVFLILGLIYAIAVLAFGVKLIKSGSPITSTQSTITINGGQADTLSSAILASDVHRVKILLNSDPTLARKKGPTGETPLFAAAFSGNRDIVQALIDHGAEVNAADDFGKTALDKAQFFHHDDIVSLLKSCGARNGKNP